MIKKIFRLYSTYIWPVLALFLGIAGTFIPLEAGKTRPLAIYLDYNEEDAKHGVFAQSFGVALHRKACPIIVSQSILRTFLTKRYTKKAEPRFTSISFAPEEWEIYHIPDTSLFVFLPKTNTTSYDDSEVLDLGIDKTIKPIQIKLLDKRKRNLFIPEKSKNVFLNLYQFLIKNTARYSDSPASPASELAKVFTSDAFLKKAINESGKRNDIKELFDKPEHNELKKTNLLHMLETKWCILLAGHGRTDDSMFGVELDQISAVMNTLNMLNVAAVRIASCCAGGKNSAYLGDNLHFMVIVDSITDAPTAGIGIADNATNQEVINSYKINEFFEAFSSSKKKNWLSETISFLSLDYTWQTDQSGMNSISQVKIPNTEKFVAFDFNKDVLILNNLLLTKHFMTFNLPIKVTDKFIILVTKPMIFPTIHIQRPKKITLKPGWAGGLWEQFPESGYLKTSNLNLSHYFVFPAFIPVNQEHELYIFNKIIIDGKKHGFLKFIRDSFFNIQERESKQTFLISTLQAANDIPSVLQEDKENAGSNNILLQNSKNGVACFSDVFIQTWHEEVEDKKTTHFILGFCLEKTYWVLEFDGTLTETIRNTQNTSPILWEFKQIEQRKDYLSYICSKAPTLRQQMTAYQNALKEHEEIAKTQKSMLTILENHGKQKPNKPKPMNISPKKQSPLKSSPKKNVLGELSPEKRSPTKKNPSQRLVPKVLFTDDEEKENCAPNSLSRSLFPDETKGTTSPGPLGNNENSPLKDAQISSSPSVSPVKNIMEKLRLASPEKSKIQATTNPD